MRLALSLPWQGTTGTTQINNTPMDTGLFRDASGNVTLGATITRFGEVAIYVGAFLMFFWAAWGVFDYIRAEGNKEALAKARKRIQWAIAGFVILLLAFFLSDFVKEILVGSAGIGNTTPPKLTF